jgi:purine-binding chemotaxis protein CheW
METMLRGERATMGVVADSVSQVIQFAEHDIEPAPAFGSRVRIEYLEGMAKMSSMFVLILNMNEVFARDEVALPQGTTPMVHAGGGPSEAASAP